MTETTKTTGGNKMVAPKILGAIAAIQAEVGNIPKNGVGPASQGAYKYIKNDDILEKISSLLTTHKVVVRPRVLKHELISRDLGGNRVLSMTVIELETTYIHIEDGSEFTVVTSAEGADNSDKGARKAYTQAQKIANLLTFSIATGEPDPDSMDPQPSSPTQSAATAKVSAARKSTKAESAKSEISAFLAEHGLDGSVANALGKRLSGGSADWSTNEDILKQVLAALKNGEVE